MPTSPSRPGGRCCISSLISALIDRQVLSLQSNRKALFLSFSLSLSLSPVSNLLVSKRLPLPQYAHNNNTCNRL